MPKTAPRGPGAARCNAAGQRYQDESAGRRRHAARRGRYRARGKKVTHHGSPPPPADDLLPPARDDASDADASRGSGPATDHALSLVWSSAARHCSVRGSCVAAVVVATVLAHDRMGPDAMVTPPDIEAQILRFYHAEKWTIGTIARQLHVHHSVVRRVLAQAGLPRIGPPPRPSQIDAYLPFIRQTLEKFPTLTASRLYVMAHERGYRGSPDHFRHLIACHRPRPTGRGVSASAQPARRTGTSRLGPLRPSARSAGHGVR